MNRTTIRTWALQLAVLAGIAMLMLAIANTTMANLDRLGVQSGFGFLKERAGFDINQSLFSYSSDSPVYIAFLVALGNTMLLTILSIFLATLIGLVVALFRISGDWFLNGLGHAFIETFRNIPALLQIFFWYYVVLRALPTFRESWWLADLVVVNNRGIFLPGIHWGSVTVSVAAGGLFLLAILLWRRGTRSNARNWQLGAAAAAIAAFALLSRAISWNLPVAGPWGYDAPMVIGPELAALILGLTFYNASYVAEVIRAGFLAIPKGQWEAARSLGIGPLHVMRHVILPQSMRVILPPLTNCYLNIFKATSLGAAVGYPEIVSVMVGTTNNLVGRPVEIMFLTFAVYSVVSLFAAWLMAVLNRRYNQYRLA